MDIAGEIKEKAHLKQLISGLHSHSILCYLRELKKGQWGMLPPEPEYKPAFVTIVDTVDTENFSGQSLMVQAEPHEIKLLAQILRNISKRLPVSKAILSLFKQECFPQEGVEVGVGIGMGWG